MPRVPQAPPPGIFRNATPEATPGKWFDANLMRFRGGVLVPIGGNAEIPGTVTAEGPPRDMLTWHDNKYTRWAAIGTDSKLWAYNFDTKALYDITPAGVSSLGPPGTLLGYGLGDYGTDTYGTQRDPADIDPTDIAALQGDMWSIATWGEDLLIVPTQDGHLFHWSPTAPATKPAIVAGAPTMNRGVAVTDQRSAVLIGAAGDPRRVAWSDQEDYTDWVPTVSNQAGAKQLQTQAYCMTSIKSPSGLLIFTSNDLHVMTYVGPPYAYGINQAAVGCGPISLRAPVAMGGVVMWPSLQRFWSWNGNAQPMKCDVQDWLFSFLNRAMIGRIFGSPNPTFAEMWWDWPDETAQECNRYIAANYVDQNWIIGVRNRTAGDPSGTMDNPILGGLAPDGASGSLYLHEFGWTANGVPRAPLGEVYIESGNIVVGEGDQRWNGTQVVLDAATDAPTGMLGYRFFTREQPYDAASERDTGLYTATHGGLMDVRFSGRSVRMRVEALVDGPFAIGKPRLVMIPAGSR